MLQKLNDLVWRTWERLYAIWPCGQSIWVWRLVMVGAHLGKIMQGREGEKGTLWHMSSWLIFQFRDGNILSWTHTSLSRWGTWRWHTHRSQACIALKWSLAWRVTYMHATIWPRSQRQLLTVFCDWSLSNRGLVKFGIWHEAEKPWQRSSPGSLQLTLFVE